MLDSAFAWLSNLIEWLGRFVPRLVIIPTTHAAVKFVRGAKVVPLKPGLAVYWPVVTEISVHPTARQAFDLRTQIITTVDGKTIAAGGLIVYRIVDIEKLLAHTFEADTTIREIALPAIHAVLCRKTWDAILVEQTDGRLDAELLRECRDQLAGYGVKLMRCTLTDLAITKVYKVLQSMSTD